MEAGIRSDLVATAIPPDYALSSHVAPLGVAMYTGTDLPANYRGGAFVGEHGSWDQIGFGGHSDPAGLRAKFSRGATRCSHVHRHRSSRKLPRRCFRGRTWKLGSDRIWWPQRSRRTTR